MSGRRVWFVVSTGIVLAALLLAAYVAARVGSTLAAAHTPAAGILAACLLTAELFVAVQGLGYFRSLVKACRDSERCRPALFPRWTTAPVAVLVTSFNEAADVIDETLASVRAMDYPAVRIYLVDDSTREENRQAAGGLAARYGAQLVHRTHRKGYKAGAINDLLPSLTERYVAVLDADQRPTQAWLRDVVPLLESNPRLAFVQTPQVYGNLDGLPVAHAAAHQQAVFYEYICEGKGASNAMFCCGSNVVFRRDALLAIGDDVDGRRHYFDETSVTEDFATSFRLHAQGWESGYVNRPYVIGMGPETLAAYFTQQSRWAMGTLRMLLRMIGHLVRAPRTLRPAQWWEYLLSGMYYLVGPVNVVFMAAAIAYLLLGVMPVQMDAFVYLALFVPYFVFTMGLFFVTMRLRGYAVGAIWLGTALTFGSFWVFLKAAAVALLGLKRAFSVTPKAVGGRLPLGALAPQVTMLALCLTAVAAGLAWMVQHGPDTAHAVTTVWAAYHASLLLTMLVYFNRRVTIDDARPLLERVEAAA